MTDLFTHDVTRSDSGRLVVVHHRSGYAVSAQRDLVACARADEMRSAFSTIFARLHDEAWSQSRGRTLQSTRDEMPNGWAVLAPTAEEKRWRDAIVNMLDVYAALSQEDRRHLRYGLQEAWQMDRPIEVESYESERDFWARLHHMRNDASQAATHAMVEADAVRGPKR